MTLLDVLNPAMAAIWSQVTVTCPKRWGGRELKIWDADDVGCFFCFYVSWRATLKDVGARECFEKKHRCDLSH